jgi:DNA mismatch repair protein MutS
VREWKDDLVLLRKVVPGRADRSYGIQVARLAGLPPSVVARAREILNGLERDELSRGGRPALSAEGVQTRQLGLFQAPQAPQHPLLTRIRDVDVDNLTPLQALSLLADLKREASE